MTELTETIECITTESAAMRGAILGTVIGFGGTLSSTRNDALERERAAK